MLTQPQWLAQLSLSLAQLSPSFLQIKLQIIARWQSRIILSRNVYPDELSAIYILNQKFPEECRHKIQWRIWGNGKYSHFQGSKFHLSSSVKYFCTWYKNKNISGTKLGWTRANYCLYRGGGLNDKQWTSLVAIKQECSKCSDIYVSS